jgi:hypothetical protein
MIRRRGRSVQLVRRAFDFVSGIVYREVDAAKAPLCALCAQEGFFCLITQLGLASLSRAK